MSRVGIVLLLCAFMLIAGFAVAEPITICGLECDKQDTAIDFGSIKDEDISA